MKRFWKSATEQPTKTVFWLSWQFNRKGSFFRKKKKNARSWKLLLLKPNRNMRRRCRNSKVSWSQRKMNTRFGNLNWNRAKHFSLRESSSSQSRWMRKNKRTTTYRTRSTSMSKWSKRRMSTFRSSPTRLRNWKTTKLLRESKYKKESPSLSVKSRLRTIK